MSCSIARQPGASTPVAVILAGGLGTRLRALHPDCPKPMVPVLGRPFLHYLVEYLSVSGIHEIVISTGYKGDQIEAYFEAAKTSARITCVREPLPFGTGGAVAFVLSQVTIGDWFLVLNGDSLVRFSLPAMTETANRGMDGVLVGVRTSDPRRYGHVAVDANGRLRGFHEKSQNRSGSLVSAGMYFLHRSLFPVEGRVRPSSLETEWIPGWLKRGKQIAVVKSDGPFIDIGTPESLAAAASFVEECGLLPTLGSIAP
jgi:D-glycero-alpha-D-manno-heptose 1-phosphate guanylyltransferase